MAKKKMTYYSKCAVCSARFAQGVGWIDEHKFPCANSRYGWNWCDDTKIPIPVTEAKKLHYKNYRKRYNYKKYTDVTFDEKALTEGATLGEIHERISDSLEHPWRVR